jgi:hypothetical protein
VRWKNTAEVCRAEQKNFIPALVNGSGRGDSSGDDGSVGLLPPVV